jgi:DNA repair protein RadC
VNKIHEETVAKYTASAVARKEALLADLGPSLTTSNQLAGYCRELYETEDQASHQEILMVVALTSKMRTIKHQKVFVGTAKGCSTAPAPIFRFLIENNATFFALVHNHPSGDPEPSQSDVMLTTQMKHAGELMEIPLVDHLILGKGLHYNSMHGLGYLDDPFVGIGDE